MIIPIALQGLPAARQYDIRKWCADNGLLAAEIIPPVWVDTDSHVIRVTKIVCRRRARRR